MINGTHTIIYSRRSDADRAFFRDVLSLPCIDVGGGWLIFGVPPSEVAFHPTTFDKPHELNLMCENIHAFVDAMNENGVACEPVSNQGWGLLTQITLPGGGKLGVYEPLHARPGTPGGARPKKAKPKKKAAKGKRPAKKKATKKKAAKKKTTKKKSKRR